ncbi:MAG: DUF1569 domain-containing protein [Phycisphaerales bacterium]
MTDTRKVTERRELRFNSMGDILNDVEYMAAGDPPRSTGNWTSAQIIQHVGRIIDFSIEGFPVPRAPLPVRIVCRLLRKKLLRDPMKPGITLPPKFARLQPETRTTWDEAVDGFRAAITKLDTKRMTCRSPVFGKLNHEQWVQLHCRHAEMHFSFIAPD